MPTFLSLCLTLGLFTATTVRAQPVSLQFFGDVFIPSSVTTDVAANLKPLLDEATFNIINFEGAATDAFVPLEPKNFLLKMPLDIGAKLRAAHIDVATLANNHSMDFGLQGLHDTLRILDDAGIAHTGAGMNAAEAETSALIGADGQTACIVAFSRTFPASFWAKEDSPGTAFARPSSVQNAVKSCKERGFFTVAVFHWGKEGVHTPSDYQRKLAQTAIDAGADGVVGHHPHVIQDIDVYRGKPIFYSLGNFLFGSLPNNRRIPGGLGVRATLPSQTDGPPPAALWEVLVIDVNNHKVRFQPRIITSDKSFHPSMTRLVAAKRCAFDDQTQRWACRFE